MLFAIAEFAKIVQALISLGLLGGIWVAYVSWQSKQNLDRRTAAISYSLTKNEKYFNARGRLANRFKTKLANQEKLTPEEVEDLKANADGTIDDIKFVLSHWEIMAISIFDRTIDEKTCFEMVGSTLVNTVALLECYITDARKEEQNIRRYDYLMIFYEEWQKHLDKFKREGPVSRYQQYLDDGKNRENFERRLADDRADW